jgi:hypothetical protein
MKPGARLPSMALLAWAGIMAVVAPLAAQQGPIPLFPSQPAPATPAPEGSARAGSAPPSAPGEAPATPAPAPGAETGTAPPSGFQVEGLAPPQIDSIGLTGPGDGGFDSQLWHGSDAKVVLPLLSQLPVITTNPPLRALTRRLLATGAPLEGVSQAGSVLEARVQRLLAMGDLDTAKRLLDQLPPARGDSRLARLVAETALLDGEDPAACRSASDIAPTANAAFWSEIVVYCRLAQGDLNGARLGLDLLQEAAQTDDHAFFELASMIADGTVSAAPPLHDPQPIHLALLRLAKLPLPASTLDELSPAALTAVARAPSLAGDQQLVLAERAFRNGGLPATSLAALYRDQPSESGADALHAVETAWGPRTRALAYRTVLDQQAVRDRAQLLDATWRAAAPDERFLVAEVFAGPFADLPVDRGLLTVAPSIARALLGAGRPLPAARWFALLSAETATNSAARSEVAGLTPLFALAGVGNGDAVPQFDEAAIAAWRAAAPGGEAAAERLYALLEGLGLTVPETAWVEALQGQLDETGTLPSVALWRGLERAVANKRLGETLLFALHLLQGRPQTVHPEAVVASLRALRAVGLDQEARSIAVATALSMGL